MNMDKNKKLKIVAISLAAVIAVAGMFAMFGGPSSGGAANTDENSVAAPSHKVYMSENYIDALPDNPFVLVRIPADRLLDKSELLKNDKLTKVYSNFKDILPEKLQENLDSFLVNPSTSGLDFSKPLYAGMYSGDSLSCVITASVSDKIRFMDFMNSFITEYDYSIEEQDNGLCYILDPEGERYKEVVFDSKSLLYAPDGDAMLFVKEGGSSLSTDSAYCHVFEADNDIAFTINVGGVVAEVGDSLPSDIAGKAITRLMQGSVINGRADFVNGAADMVVDMNMLPEYKGIQNFVKGGNGKNLEYMPANSVAVFNFTTDMFALYDMLPNLVDGLNSTEMLDKGLEMLGIDKSLLNSLSTEFTFAVLPAALVGEDYGPRFVLAVSAPDNMIFDLLVGVIGTSVLEKVTDNVYALGINEYMKENADGSSQVLKAGFDYCLAYKNGTIFFLPQDVYNRNVALPYNNGSAWFNSFKGKEIALDYNRFRMANFDMPEELMSILNMLKIETVTVEFDNMGQARIRLEAEENDENLLKTTADAFCAGFLNMMLMQE